MEYVVHKNTLGERQGVLARSLRTIGTMTVLASALSFLLFASSGVQDVGRYLIFTLFSAGLGAAGVVAGTRFGDTFAARNLLAISAILLPAHACIVGAFLYSGLSPDLAALYSGPESLRWSVDSVQSALLLALAGIPVMGFLAALAFNVLARPVAVRLTSTYLLLNMFVMVPLRGESITTWLASAAFVVTAAGLFQLRKSHSALDTREGALCKAMLWSPVAIIAVRALSLYTPTAAMVATIFAILAFFLFDASFLMKEKVYAEFLRMCSYAANLAACTAFMFELDAQNITFVQENAVLTFGLICASGFASYGLDGRREREPYMKIAARIFMASAIAQFFLSPTIGAALLLLIVGVVFVCIGHTRQKKELQMLGYLQASSALLYYAWFFTAKAFTMNVWLGFSCVGIALILLGTRVEQYLSKGASNESDPLYPSDFVVESEAA